MRIARHVLPAALAALALFTAGCREKHADSAPAHPAAKDKADVELSPKALEAAALVLGQARVTPRRTSVVVAGTIDFVPSHVARIGPNIGGRVSQISVTPGQKVKRGAIVATIESLDVGRARGDFLAAKSRLVQADAELAREKKLFGEGSTSERAVLAAETEKSVAGYGLRAAEDHLHTLGASGEGSASAVALSSPLDGTVLEVKARVGQPVGPTDTLVVVGETDQVWLAVDVYERDVAKVHLGDEVRVSTLAYPKRTFVGQVDHLGTVIDPDRRVLQARIVLSNKESLLRPGMTATSRILGKDPGTDAGTIVTVPRGAIQAIDGQPFVFIEKEKGKFEMRAVERGADLEGDVEITRGLAGSETVVVDGSFILKSEVLKEQMGQND